MADLFKESFWVQQWESDKDSDTHKVHKGFSTSEYWDRTAATYNQDQTEIRTRRVEKTLRKLDEKGLLFDGMRVLDIGCGPGLMTHALAVKNAKVTALDFSVKMMERLKNESPRDLKHPVDYCIEDWHDIDIDKKGWTRHFDLVLAFMSPGVSTPSALDKMIACARKGCAVRGWASKEAHPILKGLWEEIMGTPLEDKPQSFLLKINLLFSRGIFPDIYFETIRWKQQISLENEVQAQMKFFKPISSMSEAELERKIRQYLNPMAEDGILMKKHKGLTGTAVWKIETG